MFYGLTGRIFRRYGIECYFKVGLILGLGFYFLTLLCFCFEKIEEVLAFPTLVPIISLRLQNNMVLKHLN